MIEQFIYTLPMATVVIGGLFLAVAMPAEAQGVNEPLFDTFNFCLGFERIKSSLDVPMRLGVKVTTKCLVD